jgi:hypothetical protein
LVSRQDERVGLLGDLRANFIVVIPRADEIHRFLAAIAPEKVFWIYKVFSFLILRTRQIQAERLCDELSKPEFKSTSSILNALR